MKSDYDTDFYEWTQHQAAALAAGHVSELDLANLAEEIESLGKWDRRGLRNNLKSVYPPPPLAALAARHQITSGSVASLFDRAE